MSERLRSEPGFAILVAIMGLLIVSAASMALVLGTSIEAKIAANFRDAISAFYAAETIAVRGLADLEVEPDWRAVVGGSGRSTFFDCDGSGTIALADRSTIDLTATLNAWNCGKPAGCSDADMDRITSERPWGRNNPRWRIYACGPLAGLVGSASPYYVVLLAADDPLETDNDPLADGNSSENPGRHVLMLRGAAYGPGGTHKLVELTVARREGPAVHVRSWRILR